MLAGLARPSVPITFGSFRLDPIAGRLTRGTDSITLRPKTWSVLCYLVERPGVLVSKENLLDAIWGTVSVTDAVVNRSIAELRVALGDSVKSPRLIETVPRRGFRFIGTIAERPTSTVMAPSSVAHSIVMSHPTSESFVGRTEQLRTLAASLQKAATGDRQIVFVMGAAGMGKTALIGALLDSPAVREAAKPVWVGGGVCIEQQGPREAYMPVIGALEGLARRDETGGILSLLRQTAPTWLAQMPWLATEDEQALRQSLQQVRPERMLREFASLVEAPPGDVTLVLVLEDLHWSDASTVDLLSLLAERTEPARLLLIGTFRSGEAIARDHGLLNAVRKLSVHRRCTEISLPDLSAEEVQQHLDARFPGNDFSRPLARRIHRHTDGNPLFMIGVIDHLRARGQILDTTPGWTLRTPLGKLDLGLPHDVQLLVENDLEDLSPADRSLLQAASVAGDNFTALVVAAALGWEVTDVEERFETFAHTQRFLRTTGHVEWPDGTVTRRYGFAHDLYRQAVYSRVTETQCRHLHQRIGLALEAAYGVRHLEIAPQLAVHFERCRDGARALRYLTAAAERSQRRWASRETMQYLSAALGIVEGMLDDPARHRRELEVRLALGAPLIDIHGFASDEVRENYERADALCAMVGSPIQRFAILYARWYLHVARAEREAIALAAEISRVARRLNNADARILADSVLLRTALYDGRFQQAHRLLQRRFAGAEPSRTAPAPALGAEPVIIARTHAALVLWFLGHPERSRTLARTQLGTARSLGHFFTLSAVLVHIALLELLRRDTASGMALAEEAVSLSAEHGFAFYNTMATVMRGWAVVQQGRVAEGSAMLTTQLDAMRAIRVGIFASITYGFLAEGHLGAGAVTEGLAVVETALHLAESTLDRAYTPELWRLKGDLLATQASGPRANATARHGTSIRGRELDAVTPAEACYERAIELARAAQAKSLELRAATSLARSRHGRGCTQTARQMLESVCRWFGDDASSADLAIARALLRELRAR